MHTRKVWYGLSAILVLISIISLATRGLNMGVDFTGGVTVQASFPTAANRDAVSAALVRNGYNDAQVTMFGSANVISIRLPPTKESTEAVRTRIDGILHGVDSGEQIQQVQVIGPQVGGELERSAFQALLATLLLIFGYIAVRFHTWRLSFGAILAVLHDPILVLGAFSLSGTTFDLTVVAAMLAVIGYSLNDTVVVFDRIRERFHLTRRLEPIVVLDQSINQTLSRTIMTSLTTALAMFALYFFGGPAVHGFALTMLVGIVIGTLSSIFFANPILYWLGVSKTDLMPVAKESPELARRP
jgi:preprotein translocase subunit SecF